MEPEFEWDPDKGEENAKKHGVSFDEAKTVLFDPLRSMVADGAKVIQFLDGRTDNAKWQFVAIIPPPPRN